MKATMILFLLLAVAILSGCDVFGTSARLLPAEEPDGAVQDGGDAGLDGDTAQDDGAAPDAGDPGQDGHDAGADPGPQADDGGPDGGADDGGFVSHDCDLSTTPFDILEYKFEVDPKIATLVAMTPGDFDTDDRIDIALAGTKDATHLLSLLKNLSISNEIDFTSIEYLPIDKPLALASFNLGGSDRDALDDLALLSATPSQPYPSIKLNVWKSDTDNGLVELKNSPFDIGQFPMLSALLKPGCFGQDEAIDLFVSSCGSFMPSFQQIYLWDGQTMSVASTASLQGPVMALAVFDLDGNGRDDLVVAKAAGNSPPPTANEIHIGLATKGDAEGIFDWTLMKSFTGETFLALAVADLSGDNIPDLVAAVNSTSGNTQIRWWKGQVDTSGNWKGFSPTFSSLILPELFTTFKLQIADLDGDRRADVIGLAPYSSQYFFFRNNSQGSGITLTNLYFQNVSGNDPTYDFFIRDMNHDGRPDLVFACSGSLTGRLLFYLNQCR